MTWDHLGAGDGTTFWGPPTPVSLLWRHSHSLVASPIVDCFNYGDVAGDPGQSRPSLVHDRPPTDSTSNHPFRSPVQFFVTAQQLRERTLERRRKSADNRERRTLAQGLVRTRLPTRAALCTVTTTAGARFRAGHRPPTRHRRAAALPPGRGNRESRSLLAV